jgi:hypothetical protein
MLAQAQRAIGVGAVDRLIQTVGTIATMQHNSGLSITAWDKLDTDEITDQYADMLGVDPRSSSRKTRWRSSARSRSDGYSGPGLPNAA